MEHLPPFPLEPCHSAPFSRRHIGKRKKPVREVSGDKPRIPGIPIYPRSLQIVVSKEKKLTHKNSPLLKLALPLQYWIQQGFQNAGTIPVGEGVVLNKFCTARLPPLALTPCPFINYFSRKRFPFHLPCFDKWYQFLLPSLLELFIPFNCCECNVFWNESATKSELFLDFLAP